MQVKRKNLLLILGSPRFHSNSEIIAGEIARGFSQSGGEVGSLRATELQIKPCKGCLKCNKTGKCETHEDGWADFLHQFKGAPHVVVATPIYFHHLPGSLKILLDRFRSQIQIQMTASGLIHNPRWQQRKKYAFVFSLADRSDQDTRPAREILTFWAKLFGARDEDLHVLVGKGLAIRRQVSLSRERLKSLYHKLALPSHLADVDFTTNQQLLQQAYTLGQKWARER